LQKQLDDYRSIAQAGQLAAGDIASATSGMSFGEAYQLIADFQKNAG
jgi:hypothetical protein